MTCRRRRLAWHAAAIIGAVCSTACRPQPAPSGPTRARAGEEASIAGQVAAVLAGQATRVEAEHPLTAAEWESLRGLPGLRELILRGGVADDSRAEVLATLTDLERLVVRESPLTDEGFCTLLACRRLRDLNVPQAACTAAGIQALAKLENLRSLRLGGTRLQGSDVGAAVAELERLRSLHLIDVPLGDEGLEAISRLPGLWNLYLDGAGVSDDGWVKYFQRHPDVHVHVDQAHHDRDPRRGHD